jgi:hypothetical protein
MCRQAMDLFHQLNPTVERLEVLVRLAPMTGSLEEQTWVLSTLLEICGDYTQRLRASLNTLVAPAGGEEVTP